MKLWINIQNGVTLKMLARRRTRSQVRAPPTMSQQRIVADYEEQVYQVRA